MTDDPTDSTETCDCAPRGLSRRGFLGALGVGALIVVAGPGLTRTAFAAPGTPAGDTLVVLDLRGGMSLLTGWLDRAISALGTTAPLANATLGSGVADRVMAGPAPVFAASALKNFTLYGADKTGSLATAIQGMHASSSLPWASVAAPTLASVATAASVVAAEATPAGGAVYPKGPVGDALADVARLIRAGVGLRFASVDMGD